MRTYQFGLVPGRVRANAVGGNFYGCTDHDSDEVASTILDEGEVGDGYEDDAIEDATEDGQRE